jgi:hypothetical protein
MGLDGICNQECRWWRKPEVNYRTAQDRRVSRQSGVSREQGNRGSSTVRNRYHATTSDYVAD